MTRLRGFLALSFVAAAGLLPSTSPDRAGPLGAVARADDAPPPMSQCTLRGTPLMARGMQVFDAAKEGRPIVDFIGGTATMAITVPADTATQRARVVVSGGKPALRVEGWMEIGSTPIYAVKDVSAHGELVKIAGGHRVKVTKGSGSTLTAELTIAGSQDQTLRGTGPCDAFSLDWARPTVPEPPPSAMNYLMRTNTLDLFDKANGENIYTLNMSDGASPLFWGVESRGMYMRVLSRSDVAIDAWVKFGTLTPIKKGDRIESPPTAPSASAGSRLVLEGAVPKTAAKELPIRARREEKDKPIGVIESGAEFFVTQVVSGWANVLPRSLNFSPPDTGGFWVREADIGK